MGILKIKNIFFLNPEKLKVLEIWLKSQNSKTYEKQKISDIKEIL